MPSAVDQTLAVPMGDSELSGAERAQIFARRSGGPYGPMRPPPPVRPRARSADRAAALGSAAALPQQAAPPGTEIQILHTLNAIAQTMSKGKAYVDPHRLLKEVDPDLKHILASWHKDAKAVLDAHVTQQDLIRTYQKIGNDPTHAIMKQFAKEAERNWQWCDLYLKGAAPIAGVPQDDAAIAAGGAYDVSASWSAMRERHARECQQFVVRHQEQQAQMIARSASSEALTTRLEDRFASWMSLHGDIMNLQAKQQLAGVVQTFAEATLRTEVPKARSRLQKLKSDEEKA